MAARVRRGARRETVSQGVRCEGAQSFGLVREGQLSTRQLLRNVCSPTYGSLSMRESDIPLYFDIVDRVPDDLESDDEFTVDVSLHSLGCIASRYL
jgi:hypothetical protein